MSTQLIILDEIGARLSNLTTANGYSIQPAAKAIKRASLVPFRNGDLPALNYWPGSDVLDSKTGQYETRVLGIVIEVYDVTRDEPFSDVGLRMGADVVTALFRDTSFASISDNPSLALGGLVSTLVVNSITPVLSEGQSPWCGAVLDISVEYNIEVGNFSTIINF